MFDAILDAGARPFVELGFMPRELATQTETLFWWKAHCSPPKDMGRWVELVTATVRHWIERYGIDEVRQWPFEVWNEPNLVPHFWTGTRTEYFELYEATARAIKAIDPGLRVGGPSTSVFVPDARYSGETHDRSLEVETAEATDPDALDWQPVWIHELIDYCASRACRSTSSPPTCTRPTTRSAPRGRTSHQAPRGRHVRRPAGPAHDHREQPVPGRRAAHHRVVDLAVEPRRDPRHALRRRVHRPGVPQGRALADSISYWTFTDVFEEGGGGIGPFHGGFGFVNEKGLHKPTFHAMAMLHRLGDRLLLPTPDGAITRSSATGACRPSSSTTPPTWARRGSGPASPTPRREPSPRWAPSAASGTRSRGCAGDELTVEILDWEHGNVAEAWHQMGAPLNLTREQTAELRHVADGLHRRRSSADDGVLDILTLPAWAVASVVQEG